MQMRRVLVSAFVALGMLATATTSGAVRMKQKLTATASAPGAHGQAVAKLKSDSKGRLRIGATGLAGHTTFDLVANGVKVGTFTTSAGGSGKMLLSTSRHGHASVLGFDPRGAELEVRDEGGDVMLHCTMPGHGDHPDKIACCLPSGETGCQILPAQACAANGGTPAGGNSCMPDPCGGGGSAGGAFVCCVAESTAGAFVDDDPDVECQENATSASCAAAGGTLVSATSCHDPNPCEATPPPDLVVCCVNQDQQGDDDAQGNEAECERVTAERCTNAGGTVSTATSCDGDPCGGGSAGGSFCHHQHGDDGGDQGSDSQGGDHHPGD
jgi:hypothetical protein